jgi:hypothetical protein
MQLCNILVSCFPMLSRCPAPFQYRGHNTQALAGFWDCQVSKPPSDAHSKLAADGCTRALGEAPQTRPQRTTACTAECKSCSSSAAQAVRSTGITQTHCGRVFGNLSGAWPVVQSFFVVGVLFEAVTCMYSHRLSQKCHIFPSYVQKCGLFAELSTFEAAD